MSFKKAPEESIGGNEPAGEEAKNRESGYGVTGGAAPGVSRPETGEKAADSNGIKPAT